MNGEKLSLTFVSSSSKNTTDPATNAFDGNTTSSWASDMYAVYPQDIVVELNDFYALCGFRILSSNPYYRPGTFKILGSPDGLEFNEIYSGVCEDSASFLEFEFSSKLSSKYVKIEFTGISGIRVRVYEFELYGTLAEPDTPDTPALVIGMAKVNGVVLPITGGMAKTGGVVKRIGV